MYAVGRLGSYITRGVYTVSGTFHPFGGAVDIIVVEQPDGSFKSSPWYVRFGKFQGVLKAREKVVNINVNGVDADFHMYLDQSGQAYFLREVEGDEGESVSSFSGDDTDEQLQKSSKFGSGDQIGESDRKVVARSNAHRSKICSVFGQRPTKEDGYRDEGASSMNSLERAEFAADLLDMKWSTNLDTIHPWKAGDASACYALGTSHGKCDKDILTKNGQSQVGLSLHDAIDTSVDQHILAEEIGSCNVQRDDSVWCGFEIQEFSAEEDGLGISSLGSNTKQIVGNVILDESTLEENLEEISAISRNITGYTLLNTDEEDNAEGIISEVNCPDNKFNVESSSDESNVALIEFDICEESKPYRTQSFINETSENSVVGFNGSKEQSEGSLHLTCGGSGEVPFSSAALDMTTPEDRVTKQAEKTGLDILHSCDNNTQHTNPSPPSICDHDELNLELTWTVSESYTQMVTMDPICGFVEVETSGIDSISGFSNSVQQIQNEINVRDEISRGDLQPLLKSVGDSEQLNSDSDLTKSVSVPLSESSEEDQFLFSDLDDLKHRETEDELNFPVSHKEDHHPSSHSLGTEEMNELVITNDECNSSQDSFSGNNQLDDTVNIGNLKVASSPICIPTLINNADTEVGQLAVSLPNLWSYPENLGAEDVNHPLSHSLDSGSKCLDRQWHRKDGLLLMNSGTDNENQSSLECSNKGDSLHSEDVKSALVNPAVGDPSNAIVTTSGSWIFWPFSFKRSRSRKATQPIATETASSDAGNVSHRNIIANSDKMIVKPKALKKMVRANTPTSEEVASLNLKEGSNVVTFTFFTAMLGRQKVDARIYLWKWNTRIVISDVDGTITRSDVLGQFMPLVGVDWSQTGVAHLFSAIKENGYQLLFLSARAISQAYITRQFLVNLKQDGKALPDGPVVISPDGLFPSLFREVIRRAPHEFKIACLEDIKALFPPDCNPFYAGFGNRDTDEISYLKIGIPKGKIFIINPKGEVVVNRRVDSKSYTSLHDLVHDMFPAMTSSEQEDYNSWNYWRLPPPDLKL